MSDLRLDEETLSDGSKVYSVVICNRMEINCDSHADADALYDFLTKYESGICDMGKY